MVQKTCAVSGKNFVVTDQDLNFYNGFEAGSPTLCPEERKRRRLAWRNERSFYWRNCDGSGTKILSSISPDKVFKIYSPTYWYSDKWNGLDYGMEFDFNQNFFPQFRALMEKVPMMALSVIGNENCDYVNRTSWSKNCYLIFDAAHCEQCFYSEHIGKCSFCSDCSRSSDLELCYECENTSNCYNAYFLRNCRNISDSWFLNNCIGCRFCFGCVNMKNKEYYFLNESLSKEAYEEKLASLRLDTNEGIAKAQELFDNFLKKFPCKYIQGNMLENSMGNNLYASKNCYYCFDTMKSQDSKYLYDIISGKDSYDVNFFGGLDKGIEKCLECHDIGDGVYNAIGLDSVIKNCYDIFYSREIISSNNLLGCIGLQHQSHCIFNKKYSEEDYIQLKNKIIEHMKKTGEWGEFFPISISPFAYNETLAQETLPIEKAEADQRSWQWKDDEPEPNPNQEVYVPSQSIDEVGDEVLEKVLKCDSCQKFYRIVKSELNIYRKIGVPIPKNCFRCRYISRSKSSSLQDLYEGACGQCGEKFETVFSPDTERKVYCENCYLKITD